MKIDVYSKKNTWKLLLFLCAVGVGAATLLYTETFLQKLRDEEEKKLQLWAESLNTILTAPDDQQLTLASRMIESNTTIPLIMTDGEGQIISVRNLDPLKADDPEYQQKMLSSMQEENEPIQVVIGDGQMNLIYYRHSHLLTQLRIYPLILLGVIGLLVGVAYLAFSSARRAEQDRVWTGMARETAHQIGTPLSSLVGWVHLLREKKVDSMITDEMERDVQRLERITDRFSKIGSIPELKSADLTEVISRTVDYLSARAGRKVVVAFSAPETKGPHMALLNAPLFEWVLENLIRNGIDALDGEGSVVIRLESGANQHRIIVEDDGKGMGTAQQRSVFRPGFTTKKRGWGLGLTLAQRIVEQYHNGQISVQSSELGKGTRMLVRIPKA